ncbi:putative Apolipoprotein D [Hypsibius exemplaris]|uniref:Apolipoprotein D n=1 Tax=Hypsibius exemplaris TaxID=2072580 RepID=A0A1W0W9G3_HYPEX|nr:putative Apolipoprotein D [Hypsibius exemplaris]
MENLGRIFILLAVCLGLGNAQTVGPGKCPTGQTFKANFEAEKYVGNWFEIQSYPSSFQAGLKCSHAIYTPKSFAVIEVKNSGTFVANNTVSQVIGTAYIPDPINEPAKLIVGFPPMNGKGGYWVMDTDYTSYSVVYSCAQIGENQKIEFAWVLSRTKTLSDAINQIVQEVLTRNSIDQTPFQKTSQEGCANHPEVGSSTGRPDVTSVTGSGNGAGTVTFALTTGWISVAITMLLARF